MKGLSQFVTICLVLVTTVNASIALPSIPTESPPTYTAEQIQTAKDATTLPWVYKVFGLPTDQLSDKAQNDLGLALGELLALRLTFYKEPIEKQARYADAVCRLKTADSEWVEKQLSDKRITKALRSPMMECGIGNMAYFSLYAPKQSQRDKARALLQQYIEWADSYSGRFWIPMYYAKALVNHYIF